MRDEMDALVALTSRVTDAEVEALSLRSAETDLMEEIMSTPTSVPTPTLDQPRRRRSGRRLAALAGAAAVAAAGVLVVQSGGDDRPAWAAELVEVAESAPRLLVDDPEWEVTRADEFGVEYGEMTFTDGTAELEIFWMPGSEHDQVVEDRRASADLEEPITVAGHEGLLMRYKDDGRFTTMWEQDGYSVEAVGQTFDGRDAYEAVLARLRAVDVDSWLTAMPASIVKPSDERDVVADMLADISAPAGFDAESAVDDGVHGRYQVGAALTGQIACTWIDQWLTATAAGDSAAADEAAAAMGGSHDWAILEEMAEEGGYPDVIWEYADAIANGGVLDEGERLGDEVPIDDAGNTMPNYRLGLGCD